MYLYALLQGPGAVASVGSWAEGAVYPSQTTASTATSQSLGGYVSFGDAVAGGDNTVEARVGLSFVSMASAENNADVMIAGRSFDQVVTDSAALWAEQLSMIEVNTARSIDAIKMYTSLYRTFMSPTIYNEADGSYLGVDELVHYVQPGENYYSDMSLWDTYRTQNPWLVFARPDVARDVAHSLVLMVEQGTNLPRWCGAESGTGVRGGLPSC